MGANRATRTLSSCAEGHHKANLTRLEPMTCRARDGSPQPEIERHLRYVLFLFMIQFSLEDDSWMTRNNENSFGCGI